MTKACPPNGTTHLLDTFPSPMLFAAQNDPRRTDRVRWDFPDSSGVSNGRMHAQSCRHDVFTLVPAPRF